MLSNNFKCPFCSVETFSAGSGRVRYWPWPAVRRARGAVAGGAGCARSDRAAPTHPDCVWCGRRCQPRRGWRCTRNPAGPEKAAAVVLGGINDRPAADQPMPPVDADVALGAEDQHCDLNGSTLCSLWCGFGSPALERPLVNIEEGRLICHRHCLH